MYSDGAISAIFLYSYRNDKGSGTFHINLHWSFRMKRPPLLIVYFSTALSIVTLGDSLLYAILPSYYPHLGLAPIQVGILLSVNRWIRLSTNHLAEYCYRKYPGNPWVLFAFFTGSMVAIMYGLAETFVVFLIARILWGISFSFLRQAGVMTAVRSGVDADLGERMGYFRGINALLRAVGLFVGCFLHDVFGFSATLIGLGVLSFSAIPLGYHSQRRTTRLRETPPERVLKKNRFSVISCGFVLGIVGPGMIISTLGLVLKTHIGESFGIAGYSVGIATLTGLIIGIRWFVDGIGSPVIGTVADRLGRQQSLSLLFSLNTVTLITIAFVTIPVALIFLIFVFFICSTAQMTLLSAQAGESGPRSVASYATAMDFGMSIGPLIAWGIAQFGLPTSFIFISGGVIYGIGSVIAVKTFGIVSKS